MEHSNPLSEAEIITRILNGEKSLYELIVRRFNPHLYKIGRTYNYSHEDTRDLMQETFIDAYKHLAQFKGNAGFKTWIIRIMMNNCYRKKEKAGYKYEVMQDINEHSTPMFTQRNNDTEMIVQNRELQHIIENAIGKLPFDYRVVFSLRELNGLNTAEVAGVLGITETNVKARHSRSKAMLRNEIEKTYTACELFEFNLIHCDAIVEEVMKKINDL